MFSHETDTGKLEQLLESLIKMVGTANKNVASLQQRTEQLEMMMWEQQVDNRKHSSVHAYSQHPRDWDEKIPSHL
ncbi:hypothetical protein [Bacillus rubiinfantis]|uniref:hypothetical protein n=1 Tax=Bacillus rubiinfantis TaxID=1499680 RepID=UPI0005AA19D2|nr:hypothetical protein [Bacillus rubiinfantis]